MPDSPLAEIQDMTRRVLDDLLVSEPAVALLDFPAHENAGDQLIYVGELNYLRERGARVDYLSACHTYSKELQDRLVPHGPLLMHGGGNFGDRYPIYQRFREHVIDQNPDRHIVLLPQSIEFSDDAALERARSIYSNHPNLSVLIRDSLAAESVKELFGNNDVRFCPDMAYGAGFLTPASQPDHEIVLLKRSDTESAHGPAAVPEKLRTKSFEVDWSVDWFGVDRAWWPGAIAAMLGNSRASLRPYVYRRTRRVFERQSEVVVSKAIKTLSRGHVVVTDRLHAAILGTLLQKPVVMVDNVNRKLAAAYRDHLHNFPSVVIVSDFHEAAERAKDLV